MAQGPDEAEAAKAAIRERFTQRAHHSAGGAGSDLPAVLELVRQLDLRGTEDVVDVATGGGALALAMAPHARHVTGVDLTPAMLQQARETVRTRGLANVDLLEGDVEALPLADGCCDVITSCRAVHHFHDMERSFAEMRRVLRPGGRLGVVDFATLDDPDDAAFLEELERVRDHGRMKVMALCRWPRHLRSLGFHLRTCAWFLQPATESEWLQRVPAGEKAGAAERLAALFAAAPAETRSALDYRPVADRGEPAWGRPYIVLVAQRADGPVPQAGRASRP
jgi:SAM-dependent methyltransferase